MVSAASPVDLVEILLGGHHPSLEQWEEGRRFVDLGGCAVLDGVRAGLDGEREVRWATAVVLAGLGAPDGDELALLVLSEFDLGLIPHPVFRYWEQASWHLRDAIREGRRPEVREIATRTLERADLAAPEWTDVVDEALGLLDWIELDARAVQAVERVATDHWNEAGRNHAVAILDDFQRQT